MYICGVLGVGSFGLLCKGANYCYIYIYNFIMILIVYNGVFSGEYIVSFYGYFISFYLFLGVGY